MLLKDRLVRRGEENVKRLSRKEPILSGSACGSMKLSYWHPRKVWVNTIMPFLSWGKSGGTGILEK